MINAFSYAYAPKRVHQKLGESGKILLVGKASKCELIFQKSYYNYFKVWKVEKFFEKTLNVPRKSSLFARDMEENNKFL